MGEPSKDLVLDTGCPELTMYFNTGPWNDHSASDTLWPKICDVNTSCPPVLGLFAEREPLP
jgi:hypothetical protein